MCLGKLPKEPTDDFGLAPLSTSKTGRDNQEITIEYKENTAGINRKAILTLAATGTGTERVTITLTQAAAARQLATDKTRIPVTVDAGDAIFNVTANVPWEITKRDTDDWITTISHETGSANQEITITYQVNTTFTSRDAVLTLAATGAGATEMFEITITQAAAVPRILSASTTSFTPTATAGNVTFEVSANVPWEITKRDTDDWITDISPDTGSDRRRVTITYNQNTTSTSREAILTLAATDAGTESETITITQAAATGARILSASTTSLTPTAAAGNVTFDVTANVDWAITKRDTASWISDHFARYGNGKR